MADPGPPGDEQWAGRAHSPLEGSPSQHERLLFWGAAGFLVVIGAVVLAVALGAGDDAALEPGIPEPYGTPSSGVPASTTEPATTTSAVAHPTTTVPATPEPAGSDREEIAVPVDEPVLLEQFSGVVLVAKGDEVAWTLAAGLADRESDIPIELESRFNLGSMIKMFTAVGIVQLMEQGLLTLDGNVGEYLPDYPNGDVAARVTVEQLLTHTSGLGDVFTEEFEADPHRFRSTEDFVPLFVDEPLLFTPGDRFSYSNAGYVVLGLIIEELSGLGYYEYLREHVFETSGMAATGFPAIEDDAANLAVGYTTVDFEGNDTGTLTANTALMPGRGFAAGGGYSTAGDLHRFRNALFDHRLLSAESLDLLITGKVTIRDGVHYAYGFIDRIQAGQRVVGHSGGAPGVCSLLSIYPETGHTIVILSNSDHDCIAVLDQLTAGPLE